MKNLAIILAAVLAADSSANSITTMFIGGNNGDSLWTNYFDVTVLTAGIDVFQMDINTNATAGSSVTLDIYTRSGTFSGFETNGGAGWTLVSSGIGVAAGANTPSVVDVTDFTISSGVNGMAVRYMDVPPVYTDGDGSNQHFMNADVMLDLGSSAATTAGAFAAGSSLFSPRVWNGTIHYAVVPEPASLAFVAVGFAYLVRRRPKS